MSEVRVTAPGNLTTDPEVTEVGGSTKAKFTIATNPSVFRNGQWEKLPPVFTTCEAWGGIAQAVAAKFRQGSLVLVTGAMRANEYEGSDGQKKRFQFLRVEEIGTHIADRSSANDSHSPSYATETGQFGGNQATSGGWGVRPGSNAPTGDFGGWGGR